MFIGIDGNEANITKPVGSNLYAHHLLHYLAKSNTGPAYQIYLKQPPLPSLPQPHQNWHYHWFGPAKLWTQWRLPFELFRHFPRPALFFSPGHYAPRFSPVPSVISIMDLAFLYYPQTYTFSVLRQLRSWTKYSIKQASHIFTISQSTKRDIVSNYHIPPDRITVTHLGPNIHRPAIWNRSLKEQIMAKYRIPGKYFIYVGTRQPRKNLDQLIRAFNSLQAGERDIFLVIVGKIWDQFARTNLDITSNIIVTDYLPDSDLAQLILGAEALVLPSLYEGFGIPVLEAMNIGTLVTASNTSSIPEITGESPLLFKPTDHKHIASKLHQVLHMPLEKKKKMIREGKIRAKLFTWDHCGSLTKEVLHALALHRQIRPSA